MVSIQIFSNNKKGKHRYKNISFKNEVFGDGFLNELSQTDFLLVLDNKKEYSEWIPSKLYEAMAFGRPIVFFSDNTDSVALSELKKYDLLYVINHNKISSCDLKELQSFINSSKFKTSKINFYDTFPLCKKENVIQQILHNV